jgi:hypothetical protein
VLGVALALPACEPGYNFTIFGYTTQPNYNCNIHTVYVPIFKNRTFYKGLEFDLTRAVIREIEAKTPYKVISDCAGADTQLTGTIISFNKDILNRNQLNEVREAQTTLGVEVEWKDLRSGEVLSQPKRQGVLPAAPSLPSPTATPGGVPVPLGAAGTAPPPPGAPVVPPPPPPVLVQSIAGFIPELGQSLSTAQQQNIDRLAIQIVSMMEKAW